MDTYSLALQSDAPGATLNHVHFHALGMADLPLIAGFALVVGLIVVGRRLLG